jgi:hypothetical protein
MHLYMYMSESIRASGFDDGYSAILRNQGELKVESAQPGTGFFRGQQHAAIRRGAGRVTRRAR